MYDTHLTIASSSSPQIGSNAVADGMGHWVDDNQSDLTHLSAPNSETPAQEPVGGSHMACDIQRQDVSPSSFDKAENREPAHAIEI